MKNLSQFVQGRVALLTSLFQPVANPQISLLMRANQSYARLLRGR